MKRVMDKRRAASTHAWSGLRTDDQIICILSLFLFSIVTVSALAVVMTKHIYRQQIQHLYQLTQSQAEQQARWNQLQAEYSSLSALDQVEWIARHELGMKMPTPDDINR